MKRLFSLLLLSLLLVQSGAACAQQVQLSQLLKLGTLPPGLPLQRMTAALFPPDWTFRGTISATQETFWTAGDTLDNGPDPEVAYESSVSLRPMPGDVVDVLYKTGSARNVEAVRKELKRLKLPVAPVTCLSCTGERYEGPNYSLTLYSGKKGPHPYILVLHQAAGVAAPAREVPVATPTAPTPATPTAPTPATPAAPAPELIGAAAKP